MKLFIKHNLYVNCIELYLGWLNGWTSSEEVSDVVARFRDPIGICKIIAESGVLHNKGMIMENLTQMTQRHSLEQKTSIHEVLEEATRIWHYAFILDIERSDRTANQKSERLMALWRNLNYTPRWNSFLMLSQQLQIQPVISENGRDLFIEFLLQEMAVFAPRHFLWEQAAIPA